MKHVWSIICNRCITDQETNSISLIDVIEEFNIRIDKKRFKNEGKVMIPSNFNITHLILKDENMEVERGSILIEFFDPSGKKHKNELIQKIEIGKSHKRIRARFLIGAMSFKEPGRYIFSVKMKGEKDKKYKKVAELPLDVNFNETAEKK
ncbi:MAG: hypothetical protein V1867_02525 [Candidatus Falkowbacteria bacterium]